MGLVKRICLDFDSTLNNLNVGWMKWIEKEFGEKVSSKEISHYNYLTDKFGEKVNDFWRTPGVYYGDINPLPGSHDLVDLCRKLVGKNNVSVVTSGPHNMRTEKEIILKEWYDFDENNIFHAHDKSPYTKEAILIDDHWKHVIKHIRENKMPGIIFNLNNSYGWSDPDPSVELTDEEDYRYFMVKNYQELRNLLTFLLT